MVRVEIGSESGEETIVTLSVPPGQAADTRADVYLTRILANATRTKVQRGIKEGRVLVNGKKVKASYTVQPGDVIECTLLRPPPIEARPEAIPLNIVYEDNSLIVLNKDAGMVVHPAYGNRTGTLVNALLHHTGSGVVSNASTESVHLSTSTALPGQHDNPAIRPGIVHRLDKDTSGLMVIAKNDIVHAHLAQQFYHRTIGRRYVAIVWGHPRPSDGLIEATLARDPRNRKRMAVVDAPSAKAAATRYETVESYRDLSLLRLQLLTGRTHQIRVHAAHIGHAVFGDHVYGGRTIRLAESSRGWRKWYLDLLKSLERQALHAATLEFTHPGSGRRMSFEADAPADMQQVISLLRGTIQTR
ncbi:MAG TPA: RluA family pseudouridine synthase [Rhodothermales bacterium]